MYNQEGKFKCWLRKDKVKLYEGWYFCQVEVKTKIYELLYPGRQSHFKGQSASQSSRLFKNYLKGQGGVTVQLNKEERCHTALDKDARYVSLWFKKVAFGLWNEIRSKSPRPSRRPFVIIFFQFDNFSAGMHFLSSSCRLWCKPTARSFPWLLLLCPLSGTAAPWEALQVPDGNREERWMARGKKVNQSNVRLGRKMGIMGLYAVFRRPRFKYRWLPTNSMTRTSWLSSPLQSVSLIVIIIIPHSVDHYEY